MGLYTVLKRKWLQYWTWSRKGQRFFHSIQYTKSFSVIRNIQV